MDNPRYEAQNLTLKGFFETGIWVIARIMLLPSLLYIGMIYFNGENGPSIEDIITRSLAPSISSIDTLDISSIIGGSGHSSSGRMLGFGVGSAPISPGAKWIRP